VSGFTLSAIYLHLLTRNFSRPSGSGALNHAAVGDDADTSDRKAPLEPVDDLQ